MSKSDAKKYDTLVKTAESLDLDIIILVGPDNEYNGALIGNADFIKWFQKNVETSVGKLDDTDSGDLH